MDNNSMKVNEAFAKIVSNINFGDKSLRQYFEETQEYYFGGNYRHREFSERKIRKDLVNSIRHNNSFDYNADIRQIHHMDKRNKDANYKLYKNIILSKIAEAYPFLSEECNIQKFKVDMVTIIGDGK